MSSPPTPSTPGGPQPLPGSVASTAIAGPAETAGLGVHPAAAVARGLRTGDPAPALDLLGQGPGLTPSGDDVVAGAAAALAILGRLDPAASAAVVGAARTGTTVLSAALLRCATRGEMVPQAAELLR